MEMGEENPGLRVEFWNSLLSEITAKLMKMRGKGRHRGCRCCLWCSRVGDLRVEHQGFTFSEIVRRKRLEGQTLSEAVIDTARIRNVSFQIFKNYQQPFI